MCKGMCKGSGVGGCLYSDSSSAAKCREAMCRVRFAQKGRMLEALITTVTTTTISNMVVHQVLRHLRMAVFQ